LNSLLDEAKEATKKACVNFAKSNHAGELKCVGLL
jgi:hypothetical protein